MTILVTVAGRAYPGVMTLTVHLPGELAAALEAEAARRGQSTDQVAADADDMLAEGFGRDQ